MRLALFVEVPRFSLLPLPQTETPEQLKARNAKRTPGTKMVNVVERQAVAVLSRGTLIDPEMVAAHPDAAYVLAGGQERTEPRVRTALCYWQCVVGVCAVLASQQQYS